MTCKQMRSFLEQWLDGTLRPEQIEAMEQHARTCPDCAAELDALNAWHMACQDASEMPVPPTAAAQWRQAIREEARIMSEQPQMTKTKKPLWKPTRRTMAWAGVAAAALVLVIGTAINRGGRNNQTDMLYLASEEAAPQAYTSRAKIAPNAVAKPEMLMEAEAPMAGAGEAYDATDGMLPMTGADNAQAYAPPEGLRIIRTASFELTSLKFDEDLAKLDALVKENEGWAGRRSISGQPFTAENGYGRTAYLVLRIPASKLDAFLAGVSGVGTVLRNDQDAQDISENYADAQARLDSAILQRGHLEQLIGTTGKLADLIELQQALANVQYEIDSLTGRLRGWDSQVDYSEVTVTLTETRETTRILPPKPSFGQRISETFFDAINGTIAFFSDMLLFVVAIAPTLVALAVAALIVRGILRSRKKRKQQTHQKEE